MSIETVKQAEIKTTCDTCGVERFGTYRDGTMPFFQLFTPQGQFHGNFHSDECARLWAVKHFNVAYNEYFKKGNR